MLRRKSVSLVVCICFLSLLWIPASACGFGSVSCDFSTGWYKMGGTDNRHMGSRITTYRLFDTEETEAYRSYITSGIAMWGNLISCTELNSDSAKGLIMASGERDFGYQVIVYASVDSDYSGACSISSWVMEIYCYYFDDLTATGKIKTIAHEIGHVYGLGHSSTSSDIMYLYANDTREISSKERVGMQFVTHVHFHDTRTQYSYEANGLTHKKRCTVCKAYTQHNCSYTTQYHSGNYHYFQMACSCQGGGTRQIPCNPNTCPYGSAVIM